MPDMARRSATNERYQKYTSPSGKTRKSAAAAKPKRATGAAPAKAKGKSTSSGKSGPWTPQTPEYKRLRKLWWWLLGSALVLTTASWAVRTYAPQLPVVVSSMMLGAAYAAIFTALYIDWTKMRKMRNEWVKAGRPAVEPTKSAKAEKADSSASGQEDRGDATDRSKSTTTS